MAQNQNKRTTRPRSQSRRARSAATKSGPGGVRLQVGKTSPSDSTSGSAEEIMRLNRFIARSGICSRRDADVLIQEGKVRVNGQVESRLGSKVSANDIVDVNGKRIIPLRHEWILMNKPSDTITTTSDERGRKSVMDLIQDKKLRSSGLFPVGRLDRNTTGVLLLTNDGELAHRLMHPSYVIEKIYRVHVTEPLTTDQLESLRTGIMLEDGIAAADHVACVGGDPQVVALSIHEGRNRQVRRMLEGVGAEVRKLDRMIYAGLTTRGIRPGKWRRLSRQEITRLYRTVKL